jgi:hypothetical protein
MISDVAKAKTIGENDEAKEKETAVETIENVTSV